MFLIATKPMSYATRRLQAGDEFEASDRDGRLLVAIKKARVRPDDRLTAPPARVAEKIAQAAARPAPEPAKVETAPKEAPPAEVAETDIASLREAYTKAIGKRPFNGWLADELRRRIAEAGQA